MSIKDLFVSDVTRDIAPVVYFHEQSPEKLESETLELAQRLANGPTVAYRYMKENLNRAVGGEMGECLDLEATHHVHTGLTEDHRQATRAFVEKRTPVFKGR